MIDFSTVTSAYFSLEQAMRIRATRIGIAGAGGLGSNCAHALVRCGFEKFVIVDFDVVEACNLNRQFFFADQVGRPKVECLRENLRRINPEALITTWQFKLDADSMRRVFAECDVVVEAFDRAEFKALLVATFAESGLLVVSGSGLAGFGDSDQLVVRKPRKNLAIVGDGVSEVGEKLRPLAPRVAVAAAKMADEVLAWVLRPPAPASPASS